MTENELATLIVEVCIKIHRRLGAGLFESAYESILAFELGKMNVSVERQVPLPLIWDGMLVKECYRADLIVDKKVLLELKSLEKVHQVHKKQLLTYLRVTGLKLGMLLNFGADFMKDGISRIVNGL